MISSVQIPQNIKSLLDELVAGCKKLFSGNLVGVYLHGSLTMGSFNPESSDIDVLIVVREKMSLEEKQSFAQLLVLLNDKSPKNGFEVAVMQQAELQTLPHPTPIEFGFHFSEKEAFRSGAVDLVSTKVDADLAAHLMVTKRRGICLYGESIDKTFPEIPRTLYLKSIAHDFDWSYGKVMEGADAGMGRVPPYAVLNTCRILGFIKEGGVMSKAEGGKWGLEHLPKQFYPIIQEALNEYLKSGSAKPVDLALLKAFMVYAKPIIDAG